MARGKRQQKVTGTCGECAHSYDFHEIGADGKPFMCRCPFFQYCRFIDDPACDNYTKRQ